MNFFTHFMPEATMYMVLFSFIVVIMTFSIKNFFLLNARGYYVHSMFGFLTAIMNLMQNQSLPST